MAAKNHPQLLKLMPFLYILFATAPSVTYLLTPFNFGKGLSFQKSHSTLSVV